MRMELVVDRNDDRIGETRMLDRGNSTRECFQGNGTLLGSSLSIPLKRQDSAHCRFLSDISCTSSSKLLTCQTNIKIAVNQRH